MFLVSHMTSPMPLSCTSGNHDCHIATGYSNSDLLKDAKGSYNLLYELLLYLLDNVISRVRTPNS
jgi:hypothetical protein